MTEYFYKNIKSQFHSQIPRIKFKTNFSNCILTAFEKKHYDKTQSDDWDIIWSEKQFINELYERKLQPHQRINHFRNYFQLCRKDLLNRNIKKHKKALEREGRTAESQSYTFCPQTYLLPSEYVIFADEFKKSQAQDEKKNVWIMKPVGRSQGKGIFLFNKLTQVSQWETHSAENYIVQKYINDPLLLGGKKFDMRIYVLVTSYSPLTVYLYRSGFARFTHVRYDDSKINQFEMHLTNVAIQKNAENYDGNIGGKWQLDKLKNYLASKFGGERVNVTFFKIQQIIIKTLQALQKTMSSDRNNSFELYGFDVMLDSKLEPWLIQVNGSPSMTANTISDEKMKIGLVEDTLLIIDMEHFLTGGQDQIGGFDLICKEKANKNNQIFTQKFSFLGTYNNRIENLKKLGKNCANRFNSECTIKISQAIKTSNNTTVNSSQVSKRNIMNGRKLKAGVPSSRDFVIKQKGKRQTTKQNEIR